MCLWSSIFFEKAFIKRMKPAASRKSSCNPTEPGEIKLTTSADSVTPATVHAVKKVFRLDGGML
jgi:hypothetical protein